MNLSFSFSTYATVVVLIFFGSIIDSIGSSNTSDFHALLEFKAKITNDPFSVMRSWNNTIHFCQWRGVTCNARQGRVAVLKLNSLNLAGSISPSIGNLSFLKELNLRNNYFTDEIPQEITHLKSLEKLLLTNNSICGRIPTNISNCSSLIEFELGLNQIEGDIPVDIGKLSKLQYLQVSRNKLTGNIPYSIGNLSNLDALSLADNKLVGKVPETIGQLQKLFFLSFGTNRLSANLIGMGGFGSVYKGTLDMEESLIAIKVFNLMDRGALESFLAECETLRNIRHRNLVKVLTVCSSVDYHGNDFKALVYEFMANGSLEEWLHPVVGADEINVASRSLNILQRLNIAIDVACALDYLHHHCAEKPIIHCDLKPSNILLDEEMIGHIGDFGLAKFHIAPSHADMSNQLSSIGIRGTIGYAPPEYGTGNEVSRTGDVYSYGILLLEMFTGRRPVDGTFNEGFNLHDYVKTALPEQAEEILDPSLLKEAAEEISMKNAQSGRLMEFLISIFEIGVACSAESPRERISIDKATSQLVLIRDELVKTSAWSYESTSSNIDIHEVIQLITLAAMLFLCIAINGSRCTAGA
ncbi:hypothetical protein JCGZ_18534 [Jatropha curcas]|uniref:non-specific serine/threonine protein kinase n=1 Tax=Jatropha curcas TaxID=180498 RepID=A0A067L9J5_JATCU|nr:hypothetical protein JCGZ_18534 [Jatropha curcas]